MCKSKNDFIDRLIEYRKSKTEFTTKTEFAEWLGINRNTYSMTETGYREPSKKFIEALFLKTGLPEEYWLYGITTNKEYSKIRDDFKMLRKAIDDIIELKLMDLDGEYTSEKNKQIALALRDAAYEADLAYILMKKKQGI